MGLLRGLFGDRLDRGQLFLGLGALAIDHEAVRPFRGDLSGQPPQSLSVRLSVSSVGSEARVEQRPMFRPIVGARAHEEVVDQITFGIRSGAFRADLVLRRAGAGHQHDYQYGHGKRR